MKCLPEEPWEALSPTEKKQRLYEQQVEMLKTLLSHGAITQAQYAKSLRDLTGKMGMALSSSVTERMKLL